MGKWLVFLIILGIAEYNGIKVPHWAWIATWTITIVGSLAIIIESINKHFGGK